jgi:hypothetical protein
VGADPAFHSKIADISQWQSTQENMLGKFMDEGSKVLINGGFAEDSITTKIYKSGRILYGTSEQQGDQSCQGNGGMGGQLALCGKICLRF